MDAVGRGHATSVEAYLRELADGVGARGRVPYGGVVEINAFACANPGVVVRVWAAPSDVLANGSGLYTIVSRHGAIGDCLKLADSDRDVDL